MCSSPFPSDFDDRPSISSSSPIMAASERKLKLGSAGGVSVPLSGSAPSPGV